MRIFIGNLGLDFRAIQQLQMNKTRIHGIEI